MVINKEKELLNLDYQDYCTYQGINWTISISLIIAVISYILVSYPNISIITLINLSTIFISLEIITIAIHFWIDKRKQEIRNSIIKVK